MLRFLPLLMLICMMPATAQAITLIINNNIGGENTAQHVTFMSPYDNEKVAYSPETITIGFKQPVRTDKSYIRVYDMYGTQLNKGEVLTEERKMSIYLPKLRPGNYRVRWRARCACPDDTDLSDTYRFTILPPGQ